MNVFDDDDDGAVVIFFVLAMFMHIFGKSDQNMVVIVSNKRQYGLLVTSSHGSELHVSGLSRGSNHYNSIHAKNMELD